MSWGCEPSEEKDNTGGCAVLMRSSIPRKFTLIDAMVLIVAIAAALVPIRPLLEEFLSPEVRSPGDVLLLGLTVSVMLQPLALTLSLALGLLRLRKPRPRLRRVFRQPGMAACTAAFVCTLVILFMLLIINLLIYLNFRDYASGLIFSLNVEDHWRVPLSFTGLAVSAVWTVLWLAKAWRPEPSWIDRSGRALGIYWVLNSIVVPRLFF